MLNRKEKEKLFARMAESKEGRRRWLMNTKK